MLVIGLTGSFGTGKTTVAALFSKLGARVLNADKIAHRVMRKDKDCLTEIIKCFGKGVLTRGRIDRKKLAGIVFHDPGELKKLENIIHPVVMREITNAIFYYEKRRDVKILVMDVPLLLESGLDKHVDVIIAVKAGQEKQIQRAMKRSGITRCEALNRIHAQMPINEKLLLSDIIVDNQGSVTNTKKQIQKIWQELTGLQ